MIAELAFSLLGFCLSATARTVTSISRVQYLLLGLEREPFSLLSARPVRLSGDLMHPRLIGRIQSGMS
jgi:hypothetical protein